MHSYINNLNTRTCNSCLYASNETNRDKNESSKEYLLDSGATTHVMTSEDKAIDIRHVQGYVLVGNGEKCKSSKVAKYYVLEENSTKSKIELKNTVIIPGFEKNIISMLRLHDDGYQFDISKERCIMTKQDDKKLRIELKPGQKGAYYLYGKTLIPNSGGSNTNESLFPLEDEIWRDIDQPVNEEGENTNRHFSESIVNSDKFRKSIEQDQSNGVVQDRLSKDKIEQLWINSLGRKDGKC